MQIRNTLNYLIIYMNFVFAAWPFEWGSFARMQIARYYAKYAVYKPR